MLDTLPRARTSAVAPEPSPATTLDELLDGERLLLSALRGWAAGGRFSLRVRSLFLSVGAGAALPPLDRFLALFRVHALRRMDFGLPGAGDVSADEVDLLDLFAQAQRGRTAATRLALLAILPPAFARAALTEVSVAAAALAVAGHILPASRSGACGESGAPSTDMSWNWPSSRDKAGRDERLD